MIAMINKNQNNEYPTIFDVITDNEIKVGTYVVLNTVGGNRVEGYYLESLSDIYTDRLSKNTCEAFGIKIDDIKGEEIVINELEVNDINFYISSNNFSKES